MSFDMLSNPREKVPLAEELVCQLGATALSEAVQHAKVEKVYKLPPVPAWNDENYALLIEL